ncbi:ABC-type transport auxiliary lipoprotein family protein [Xenophilus arseniciresistens]|uniref:ABC-type transport auxiliary lipoprotein family protein n=1 Tax=Xenophilus arseniciresistens TaxID=1283306 RepID=A0AAE3NBT7_9BURK|nr:ABC-type transport auxiliary lipoprotein family protein [Xenophilus arseniciresistens]MDA7418239.1 ABC-type transport auxiliary lipoprotein family protein [Xenophilus arseniciresistens]
MHHSFIFPARRHRARLASRWLLAGSAALLMSACGALPDKPQRATLYDFGPGALQAVPVASSAQQPALVLADIDASGRLESTQLLYRLGYADAQVLHAYSQARWSQPPAQLLRQRLRETLATGRTVLGPDEAAAIARQDGRVPDVLRISLDEFSHYFEAPQQSSGLLRLRATLLRNGPAGDRVLAQRSFTVQRPAPTADAPGGVKALTAASDAVLAEIAQWVVATQR